jgi:outer membrane protein assembly factor BamD (BamD/ComL family)
VPAPVPPKTPESAKIESAPEPITIPAIQPSTTEIPKTEPLPKPITPTSSFDLGEMSFRSGNYAKAAKYYESFLTAFPKSKDRDLALYHMGLAHALAADSSRDLRQTEAIFKRLISEFPKSPYKSEAEFILGLQSQIEKLKLEMKDRDEKVKRLSEELQKLKDIDLQRRPSKTE